MATKWSKTFWADLAERVGATTVGALLAVVTGSQTGAIPNDPAVWWTVIGVPTVAALLKGLAANLANPASGPSLLPAPPAPDVEKAPVKKPAKRAVKRAAPPAAGPQD